MVSVDVKHHVYFAGETQAVTVPLEVIPKDNESALLTHDGSLPEGFATARDGYNEHNLVRYQVLLQAVTGTVFFTCKYRVDELQ